MVLSNFKVSSKFIPSLLVILALSLTFPILQEAKGATTENEFSTAFKKAVNTPKAESEGIATTSTLTKAPDKKSTDETENNGMSNESDKTSHKFSHNQRLANQFHLKDPIVLIAKSVHGLLVLTLGLLLFIAGNLSLAAFSLKTCNKNKKHYEMIEAKITDHKWLTLIAGLINGGLITLVTLILLKKMPVIGLILLAFVINKLLQILAARVLIGSDGHIEDNLSYKKVLKLTLIELSIFLIPVYGQLELLKYIARGTGAKVLLKTGFKEKEDTADRQ
jgi:hypothetical protein